LANMGLPFTERHDAGRFRPGQGIDHGADSPEHGHSVLSRSMAPRIIATR
jgi:hypothetical protein